MRNYLWSFVLLVGCSVAEPEPVAPICYKIFEPTDEHGIQGNLKGDFPSLNNAKLYLGYHSPRSFIVAVYACEDRREAEQVAEWYLPPAERQTVRCYRMNNGRMCHLLTLAPLEHECPCGMKDE